MPGVIKYTGISIGHIGLPSRKFTVIENTEMILVLTTSRISVLSNARREQPDYLEILTSRCTCHDWMVGYCKL